VLASVARRTAQAAAIVFIVATATFVLLQLAPGDPFSPLEESTRVPPSVIEQHRRNFGLDQPIHIQYWRYLNNLVRGDFGYSFSLNRPAFDVINEAIPNTVILALAAIVIDFSIGIAVGTIQGARPYSRMDDTLTVATLIMYSMPVFWFGLMLIMVFAGQLHWLPAGGTVSPGTYSALPLMGRVADRLSHLVLPALTLGLVSAAGTARYHRGAMLETITQDFIRTARAKGLEERAVLVRHALRHAILPAVTLFGLSLPVLLSGAVLVEAVFGWNGMGRVSVDSILRRDYHVVTGAAILAALMVIVGNLIADTLYRLADPRTRVESES
jgi:peptide/nickel transport system permease protein